MVNFTGDLMLLDAKEVKNMNFDISKLLDDKINSENSKFPEGAKVYCKQTNSYMKIQKVVSTSDKDPTQYIC